MEEAVIIELLNMLNNFHKFDKDVANHLGYACLNTGRSETPDNHKLFYWYRQGIDQIYDYIHKLLKTSNGVDEVIWDYLYSNTSTTAEEVAQRLLEGVNE